MLFLFEMVLFFLILYFEIKYFNNYKRYKFCFKDCIFLFVFEFVFIVELKYMCLIISLIIYNCNGDEFYLN